LHRDGALDRRTVAADVQLRKLDRRTIMTRPGDVLCFAGVRNEAARLPYFLEYHRKLGIMEFFFIDNDSSDATVDYLLSQDDCHCFRAHGSHFALNVAPANWTNTLLNTFGSGHWCVVLDGDELLAYPSSETVNIGRLCEFLERSGAEALGAVMIDMYGDGPIAAAAYRPGTPFFQASPFFDPKPGRVRPTYDAGCLPEQMFGGVRERVFWHGKFKQMRPPCLSKVPLVKWRRGMSYRVAQHVLTGARLSNHRTAILHFKFLTGFEEALKTSLQENEGVEEAGLKERVAYAELLRANPGLCLRDANSVRYEGTSQLVRLGWIKGNFAID
jgi:glycosyl transferase family 2